MSRFTSTSAAITTDSAAFTSDDLLTTAFVAVPALALASIGGIGIVGAFGALGLSSLELGVLGGAAGYAARKTLQGNQDHLKGSYENDLLIEKALKATQAKQSAPQTTVTSTEIDDLRSGRF